MSLHNRVKSTNTSRRHSFGGSAYQQEICKKKIITTDSKTSAQTATVNVFSEANGSVTIILAGTLIVPLTTKCNKTLINREAVSA